MKPTAFGLGWLLFCVALVLLSFHFNSNLALGFTFLILSIWLASIIAGLFNFVGLRIEIERPGSGFAGSRLSIPCELNRHAHQVSVELDLEDGFTQSSLYEKESGQLSSVAVKTPARGIYPLRNFRIASDYPFGFFRFYNRFTLDHALDLIVYPKPEGKPEFPDNIVETGRDQLSDQQEVSDIREYSPGDPLSRIHWKASARGTGLVTKQFDGGRTEEEKLFRLSKEMPLEKGLSQLSLWIVEAEKQGMAFVLDLGDEQIQAGQGRHHASRCLTNLAGYPVLGRIGDGKK